MTGSALWTARDAAAATDGLAIGRWQADDVAVDPAAVTPGALFVALGGSDAGGEGDGHDRVRAAFARGAAAAVVHRAPPGVTPDAPLLVVDDTTDALGDLASFARLRTAARVIAVTGSVGKTSVRTALDLALSGQGRTAPAPAEPATGPRGAVAPAPLLALARLPAACDFAPVEMAPLRPGSLAVLAGRAKPDVAVITNSSPARLDRFESVEALADAQAEVFAGMSPAGTAILNRDDPVFPRLVAHARTRGIGRIWSFGEHADADARLVDCSLHATASAVSAVVRGEPIQYSLAAPGREWVADSLAVLLAVRAAGGDVVAAARSLARLRPARGRGHRSRVRVTRDDEQGGLLLIDETAGATPASVVSALGVLALSDTGDRGRRIAVLGDMAGLGRKATSLHLGLKSALVAADVDRVVCCGPLMAKLYDTLPPGMRGGYAPDSESAADLVAATVRPGDAVLAAGGAAARLDTVVDRLLALDEAGAEAATPLPGPPTGGDALRLASGE
ncbi:MAG: Mur ligase family protein [Azospirillaceae bacterium]